MTEPDAAALVNANADRATAWINSHITASLNQAQFDSVGDLLYNMGPEKFIRHDVWRDLSANKLNLVPDDIMTLTAGGGGIAVRRAGEAGMFGSGTYSGVCSVQR